MNSVKNTVVTAREIDLRERIIVLVVNSVGAADTLHTPEAVVEAAKILEQYILHGAVQNKD